MIQRVGPAASHIIKLTPDHPVTGFPESGVDLRLEIKDGDGLVNGGADETESFVESAVPCTWIKSWMQEAF